MSGDFDVIVRVNSLTATDPQSMAGLMARETLNANSRNAFIKVWPGTAGYRFTSRSTTGGSSVGIGSGAAAYPNVWVRLTRAGSTFTGWRSANGVDWTSVGSVSISLPQTIFVGMAVSAKSTTATTTAQFREFGPGPTAVPPPAPIMASSMTMSAPAAFSSTAIEEEPAGEDLLAGM
ncbi:MAG: hypothetical protein H0U59_00260 [Gemmatimonadaceae bacterium]|nr:hypothetical protein [Gemmatimonadaceae bacterium]